MSSPCLFNIYSEYIMQNVWLDEAQAGIEISRRNTNNLIYADDTTLMAGFSSLFICPNCPSATQQVGSHDCHSQSMAQMTHSPEQVSAHVISPFPGFFPKATGPDLIAFSLFLPDYMYIFHIALVIQEFFCQLSVSFHTYMYF